MAKSFELLLLLSAAHRVSEQISANSVIAMHLCDWAEKLRPGFVWEAPPGLVTLGNVPRPLWKDLQTSMAARLKSLGKVRPDALARNISELSSYVGLNAAEAQIFALSVRMLTVRPFRTLADLLIDEGGHSIDETAMLLTGLPMVAVRKAVSPSSRLTTTGLLMRQRPPFHGLGLEPPHRLAVGLEPPSRGLQDTLNRMFAQMEPASVDWDDFSHLGVQGNFALRLLEGALKHRERGINLLLHGAPGTGKTEFCKVIAAKLGARLHAVGESDGDGDEPSRIDRLQQLRLGQRFLASQGRSLILFDEMEDLLPRATDLLGMMTRRVGSKVHMNRLLEANTIPTLWTTNDISACDPAFLRRMTFTMELWTPSADIRARVWSRLARQHRMPLSPETCRELANEVEFAPALAGSALRAARIAKGGPEGLRIAVGAMARAVRGGKAMPPREKNAHAFDPANARADLDLCHLVDRLVSSGSKVPASLCLIGAPGTGKSAFARHLASRMNLPIIERRASDLLDKYVGGSERNIAQAFAEARDQGAFLIFDEADSLISARADATKSWEISQVNEMLTWMESHPLPFACTTNLPDRLDPAALRRFSLRITFLPLDDEQRIAAFRRCFKVDAPSGLARLDLLTPGDFAVVERRVALLGLTNARDILAELEREQAAKPNARAPIGFRVA